MPVIVGADEAHLVAGFLKENKVSVILGDSHALPTRDDDDVDLPYKRAALLKEAGVTFCISTGGYWQVRKLPFMAGTTPAYGLTREVALTAVPLDPPQILGLDTTADSLEDGQEATVITSEGGTMDGGTKEVEGA